MSEAPKSLDERLYDIFRRYNKSDRPGLVVGVAKDGEAIWRKGFGLANVEHGVANTPLTRMRIGSTSKHFTCLAALLLAEEGKLDIDASIRRYVTEYPALEAEPTLRQLMSHAGGHRCYIDTGFIADGPAIHPADEALAAQARQRAANFPPGERMLYNNGGYNMLSLAIERASGVRFEDFVKQRIFEPLGMHATASIPSDFEIHQGLAGLYTPADDGWRRGIFITEGLRGEGAMISTIDDMLRWLAHMRAAQKIVGSAESWRQLTTPPKLANGFTAQYALGLMVDDYRGVRVLHHGGSVQGGQCQMITAPDHALDIVILTNGVPARPGDLAEQVIDAVLGDDVLAPKPTPPATADNKALVGRYYDGRSGMLFGFADMDGKLGLEFFTSSPPTPLDACDEGLVSPFVRSVTGHFVFHTKALELGDGVPPETLIVTDSGNPDTFHRLPDAPPPLPGADALAGAFYAVDIDARAWFETDGEALRLRIHGPYGESRWNLGSLADDLMSATYRDRLVPWVGVVAIEREAGVVSGFTFTSRRTRKLRFERT